MELSMLILAFSLLMAYVGLAGHAVFTLSVFFSSWVREHVRGHLFLQRGGFIGFPVMFIGFLLFCNKVVLKADVTTGEAVQSACSADEPIRCFWPGIRRWNATWYEQFDLYEEVFEWPECFGGKMTFVGIPLDDFGCEDIQNASEQDKDSLIAVMTPSGKYEGQCLYVCPTLDRFVPSKWVLKFGMILSGGMFLMGFADLVGRVFSKPNVTPETTPEELVKLLSLIVYRPGILFTNQRWSLMNLWKVDKRLALKGLTDPLMVFIFIGLALCISQLKTSMVDIVTCTYLLYMCMIVWAFRITFVFTKQIWYVGEDDEFVEINDTLGTVSKKTFEMVDWLSLTRDERYDHVIRYISNIGESEANVHDGPKVRFRVICQTTLDDDSVVQCGETGEVLDMRRGRCRVKLDKHHAIKRIDVEYLLEEGAQSIIYDAFPFIQERHENERNALEDGSCSSSEE